MAAAALAAPAAAAAGAVDPIEASQGVGILFATFGPDQLGAAGIDARNVLILTGKESRFCTDEIYYPGLGLPVPAGLVLPPNGRIPLCNSLRIPAGFPGAPAGQDFFTVAYFEQIQSCAAADLNAAKVEFTNRANAIAAANGGFNIRYDTPKSAGGGIFTVNFRFAGSRWGITKGGRDPRPGNPAGRPPEPLIATCIREFSEEVGITLRYNLPANLLIRSIRNPNGTNVIRDEYIMFYSTPRLQGEVTQEIVEGAIVARNARRYGEMYDLQFRTIAQIAELWEVTNVKSQAAINGFLRMLGLPQIGVGGRRSRRRSARRRSARRRRSTRRVRR